MAAGPEWTGGIERRYARFWRALLSDPVETLLYVPEHLSMRTEHKVDYRADEAWEAHLHGLLGAPWPCPEGARVAELWSEIVAELNARGLAVGRHTYRGYSDADPALARAAWCSVVHRRPGVVLETGVARGVTTRVLLEALERTGSGRLWSIDLPHPFDPDLHGQTAAAVPEERRGRWTYVRGSSRRRLPGVLAALGGVDVFLHDSLHTARNTRFEIDRVAGVLVPGGVMLVDDISTHQAFASFLGGATDYEAIVCPSADRLGQFGVIVKGGGPGSLPGAKDGTGGRDR